MTVSSTSATELSVDQICRRAMQLAGLIEPAQGTDSPDWQAKSAMARDFLEADLEHLQTVGMFQRAVDFYEVTLTAATSTYTLPSATLDVFGAAMYQKTGETTQTAVTIVDRDYYQRITDKTAAGRPTVYYPARGQSVVVYVWPVPATADLGTVTFQRHKVLATATDGSATMDFERFWSEYFQWSLAHRLSLAAGIGLDRCRYFKSLADQALERAKSTSNQQFANTHIQIAHRTGWT